MFSLFIWKNILNSKKTKIHHFTFHLDFTTTSHSDDLKHEYDYFEVPDLEAELQRHDNPQYWLQQDILEVKTFQYRFFYNITLNNDIVPQVKVFTQFLLNIFRFNYQLLWEQQDQQAYVHFPQILTETELLPYIIKNEYRHLQYRDLTSYNTTYSEQINLDHNFITEYSETSDNGPYFTTNISHEISPEEQTPNILSHYTRQNTVQSDQGNIVHLFQNQKPQQLNPLYPQSPQTSDIQPLNPSETATTQSVSELSE